MPFETDAQRAAGVNAEPHESETLARLRQVIDLQAYANQVLYAVAVATIANGKKLDALLAEGVNSDKLAELTAELKGPTDALKAAVEANKPK